MRYCIKVIRFSGSFGDKKRVNTMGYITNNNPNPFKTTNYKLQQQEATLRMYTAVHSSIAPVDHLGQLCYMQFGCSSLKLHRIKCSNIIKNDLAPHFNEDLDIGNSFYSLLIDESTDVSFAKILGTFVCTSKGTYHVFLVSRLNYNILQQN